MTFSLTVKAFVKSFRVILILGFRACKNFLNLVSAVRIRVGALSIPRIQGRPRVPDGHVEHS